MNLKSLKECDLGDKIRKYFCLDAFTAFRFSKRMTLNRSREIDVICLYAILESWPIKHKLQAKII